MPFQIEILIGSMWGSGSASCPAERGLQEEEADRELVVNGQ